MKRARGMGLLTASILVGDRPARGANRLLDSCLPTLWFHESLGVLQGMCQLDPVRGGCVGTRQLSDRFLPSTPSGECVLSADPQKPRRGAQLQVRTGVSHLTHRAQRPLEALTWNWVFACYFWG